MRKLEEKAFDTIYKLYNSDILSKAEYDAIYAALDEVETLQDRDKMLEELWDQFTDIPMNLDTECIEGEFMHWSPGTHREEIWHWFDGRHSKGVAYLLYKDGIDRTDQYSKMVYLKQLCAECESLSCGYNYEGECRFALIHERKPAADDNGSCTDCSCHKVSIAVEVLGGMVQNVYSDGPADVEVYDLDVSDFAEEGEEDQAKVREKELKNVINTPGWACVW